MYIFFFVDLPFINRSTYAYSYYGRHNTDAGDAAGVRLSRRPPDGFRDNAVRVQRSLPRRYQYPAQVPVIIIAAAYFTVAQLLRIEARFPPPPRASAFYLTKPTVQKTKFKTSLSIIQRSFPLCFRKFVYTKYLYTYVVIYTYESSIDVIN